MLFTEPPALRAEQLQQALRARLPHAEVVGTKPLTVVHKDRPLPRSEAPYACTIIMPEAPGTWSGDIQAVLAQTREWDGAPLAVERGRHALWVTELMCGLLEPRARLSIYHDVMRALLSIMEPEAVHAVHAERLVEPAAAMKELPQNWDAYEMPLFFNVRLFRVDGRRAGEILMDTRGLEALDLPDIQVHCAGLEAGRLAGWLYGMAGYVLQNGDCIQDGHTVEGLEAGQRWRSRHEKAIVGPERAVLDINPGAPWAAGRR